MRGSFDLLDKGFDRLMKKESSLCLLQGPYVPIVRIRHSPTCRVWTDYAAWRTTSATETCCEGELIGNAI